MQHASMELCEWTHRHHGNLDTTFAALAATHIAPSSPHCMPPCSVPSRSVPLHPFPLHPFPLHPFPLHPFPLHPFPLHPFPLHGAGGRKPATVQPSRQSARSCPLNLERFTCFRVETACSGTVAKSADHWLKWYNSCITPATAEHVAKHDAKAPPARESVTNESATGWPTRSRRIPPSTYTAVSSTLGLSTG